MDSPAAERIIQSINELENAVHKAKRGIARLKPSRVELAQRLECYTELLAKQRVLAQSLFRYADSGDWDQVKRYAELIRGSSTLIQIDIQTIIEEILHGTSSDTPERFEA